MISLVPSALCVSMLLLTACAPAVITWRPSVVSQVPDNTPVQFDSPGSGEKPTRGVAVGWQRGQPRVIDQRGDTVLIPEDARLQVRLRKKSNNAPIGGLVGFVIGAAVAYNGCQDSGRTCAQDDPTPLLAATAGALIGSAIRSYPWVTVKRDAP